MSHLAEQVAYFKALLEGKTFSKTDPTFKAVVNWLRQFPASLSGEDAVTLRSLMCSCFHLTELEFFEYLRGSFNPERPEQSFAQQEVEMDELVPKTGFLRHYIEFTRNLESPYAFHLYCALLGVGAIVNRKVFIDMGGQFKVYPAMGVMLLGPSGVKKNTAGDVIVGLLQDGELTKIYQEKLTPESLVEAMKGESNAVGLVYAPEMSVFLGKQRYLEGLVPLLTRFMDCPSSWASGTIMRGNSVLHNIGISCLFGSTPDWFIKNTPADTFGGGFIARYLLVVQYGSPRIFPIPPPLHDIARGKLLEELAFLAQFDGVMSFDPKVYQRTEGGKESGAYFDWYYNFKVTPIPPEHEVLVSYYSRKPIHLLRLGMIIHLATHQDLQMCEECFERAVNLCAYVERFLPSLMRQMFKSVSGEEQELVINYIKKSGGVITHTELIRRLQYKMRASQTKEVLSSLKEAELVKEVRDNISRRYILVEAEKPDVQS